MKTQTREEWLQLGVVELAKKVFKPADLTVPTDAKVSCSWPGGGSARKRIGECWSREASGAKVNEMFISPTIEDPVRALDVLAHEVIHAIDDCKNGHKAPFTRMMKAIGLEGKPTATAAGEDLTKRLNEVVKVLGPYPHRKLDMSGRKKAGTRLIKCECPTCGYTVRTTAKWLEVGTPICPEDNISMVTA